ncbi:HEAT repeat domain-containing protein [Hymenobacter crusticola]|uniref:Putative zinc-finger domain-containing protein n=1 Tax=Hymenobacter crusticola TaxID=1770526 RepID=A0A243WJY2_9BACT|nr:HEAT repeat domain-containing protein [Hymenobacter crusticola]OUJ76214.1 hypothetical protein BXP70_02820 [Hymenobacter crusticola]
MHTSFTSHNLPASCAALEDLLPAYAEGELAPDERAHVEAHLATCPACQEKIAQYQTLGQELVGLPLACPTPEMRTDFMAMLQREKAALPTAQIAPVAEAQPKVEQEAKVLSLWNRPATRQWLQVAASLLLVAVGVVLGMTLRPRSEQFAASQTRKPSLATQLATAATQPATASDRIQLVSNAPTVNQQNDATVLVLVNTLNTDPNPNVRLAACEALYRLRQDPRVGSALVHSLPLQTDPNVQITLIELLVELRTPEAVPQLERLAQRRDALPVVRQQAEQGIGLLI